MAYEYYLQFWGGAEETIEKELGITERNFWFNTKEEREDFVKKLMKYNHSGLALNREEGEHTRKKTIAKITIQYQGRKYEFEQDFGYAYPIEAAHFMFEDGNYSCDCNKSIFIREKYPEFEEMDCGDDLELTSLEVIQV
jgi:hypothetical protein